MPYAHVRNLDLYYELDGPVNGPVVVLVHGLSTPMVAWPDSFVAGLIAQGFRTLRFDNRDIGKSSRVSSDVNPNVLLQILRARLGGRVIAPYTLGEMALDTLALLDHLDIEVAHFVGASMGGMICQILAAEFPCRALSLVSMMSTSGKQSLPGPRWSVLRALFNEPSENTTFEEKLNYDFNFWRAIGSPNEQTSDSDLHEFVLKLRTWNGKTEGGGTRHFLAILASGDRSALLQKIVAPTLVIHGADDPFVRPEAGADTAMCIENAQLRLIGGMGHDIPPRLSHPLARMIGKHLTSCAEAKTADSLRVAPKESWE